MGWGLALVERSEERLSLVNVKRDGSKVTEAGTCIEERLEPLRIASEREIVILIDEVSCHPRIEIDQFEKAERPCVG